MVVPPTIMEGLGVPFPVVVAMVLVPVEFTMVLVPVVVTVVLVPVGVATVSVPVVVATVSVPVVFVMVSGVVTALIEKKMQNDTDYQSKGFSKILGTGQKCTYIQASSLLSKSVTEFK